MRRKFMKTRIIIALLLAVACLAVLASCDKTPATTAPSTQTPATTAPATTVPATTAPAEDTALASAKAYLKSLYKDKAESTGADFTVLDVLNIQGASYTVAWSVNVTEGVTVCEAVDHNVKIDVDEKSSVEIPYVLKAVISNEAGNTTELTFNFKVPVYEAAGWQTYVDACKAGGERIHHVTAYVIGIVGAPTSSSKGSLWLQDADGYGYYAIQTHT